ncbi:MAG: pseudouridine synthase, partial [Gammaproteobacteria bacterium]
GTGIYSGAIELLRVLRSDAPVLELVHRLDKGTSGCLMVAKKRSSLREYHAMLRDQAIKKTYLVLAYGQWQGGERLVSAALQKRVHSSGERMVSVNKNGKPAQTRFKLKQQFGEFCLLQAQPLTGRTHQIRVHAAYIGYPIAGDDKYGCTEGNKALRRMGGGRLFLHAGSLKLPTQKGSIVIEAPLCTELQDLLLRLQ